MTGLSPSVLIVLTSNSRTQRSTYELSICLAQCVTQPFQIPPDRHTASPHHFQHTPGCPGAPGAPHYRITLWLLRSQHLCTAWPPIVRLVSRAELVHLYCSTTLTARLAIWCWWAYASLKTKPAQPSCVHLASNKLLPQTQVSARQLPYTPLSDPSCVATCDLECFSAPARLAE